MGIIMLFKHISDCPRYGKVRGDVGDKVNNLKKTVFTLLYLIVRVTM